MTFKASSAIPSQALETAKAEALRIKSIASSAKIKLQGGATSDEVLKLLSVFSSRKAQLQQLASTPNIAQYARDQEGDQAYDPAAEFIALINTITAVLDNITSTFPADGEGFLLGWTLSGETLTP